MLWPTIVAPKPTTTKHEFEASDPTQLCAGGDGKRFSFIGDNIRLQPKDCA
jgi:hypothetical protein